MGAPSLSLRETVSRAPQSLPSQKSGRVVMGYSPLPELCANTRTSQSSPGLRCTVGLAGELPRSHGMRKWPAGSGSVGMDRKLIRVEGKRMMIGSGGKFRGRDYAGCINEATEAFLWPISHGLLPGSGRRKAWNPTCMNYFTENPVSHWRPSNGGQHQEGRGTVPLPTSRLSTSVLVSSGTGQNPEEAG